MKKLFLSITLALLTASNLFAVKAKPGTGKIMMADGTYQSATLHGDENFHYYTLADGTPLQENENGRYEKTSLDVLHARRSQALSQARAQQSRASGIGITTPRYFPHTGTPKALVILVNFQDVKFKSSDPKATFNHYLNAEMGEALPEANKKAYFSDQEYNNYGSVKQYFKDTSMGKFVPQFDIAGPVTVSQKSAYYGKTSSDDHYEQMISEACALVADNVDFSQYDSDNDGYVDLVYIIYAGYSESISGNSSDCLWPKSGTRLFYKYDKKGNEVTPREVLKYNGKQIERFGINNELNGTPDDTAGRNLYLLGGIGLFCHEFSHTMGLPDLYPIDGNAYTANNQSPEYWDLMDAGEYVGNGYRPTPYTPWEKMMMGWQAPETLDASQPKQLTLEPYDIASKAYKIPADVNDANFKVNENYGKKENLSASTLANLRSRAEGEYLLLQNIRNKGWYKDLPGYGMLVWRIDYADKANVQLYDDSNNTKGIPRVMIVPADGLVINQTNCGDGNTYTWDEYDTSNQNDPFPVYKSGSASEYEVNSLTEVNFNWSKMTSRPLYNIVKNEETDMVTFDYLKDFTSTGIRSIQKDEDNRPTEYFDLEGRKIQTPQKGRIYITNKGKKITL